MLRHSIRTREQRAGVRFVWSLETSLATRLRFPFRRLPPAVTLVTFM